MMGILKAIEKKEKAKEKIAGKEQREGRSRGRT